MTNNCTNKRITSLLKMLNVKLRLIVNQIFKYKSLNIRMLLLFF
jgi:hypothetical protein